MAVLLGGAAVTSCNSQESLQQTSVEGLTVELSSIESSSDKGSPFVIQYILRNGTAEPVRLLPWGTPLEDELMADSFSISYKDELLPYIGRMVKRIAPVDADYITLSAHQSLEVTVDLSRAYNTSLPGKYTVQIKTFDDVYSIDNTAFVVISEPLTIERR